jgi:hypothetical protein
LEKRIKSHGYSRQQRIIGYFGEWTLGLYVIYKKKLRIRKTELIFSGNVVKTKCAPIRENNWNIKEVCINKTD